MFSRFVASNKGGLLGGFLTVLGVPGMLQDAAAWFGWFGKIPFAASVVTLCAGVLLVAIWLVRKRTQIGAFARKLLRASRAALATFGEHLRPAGSAAEVSGTDATPQQAEVNQWEVVESSVRTTRMVEGEGYPALVGMAQVKEIRGERWLYMYAFLGEDGWYMELRIEKRHESIRSRHALLRIDGEVFYDTRFDPYLTPVVADARRRNDMREEAIHLLDRGEILSLNLTDMVRTASGGERESRRDVLRVPLLGFVRARSRLTAIAKHISPTSPSDHYSPPEFVPALDPQRIDEDMKRITVPVKYDEWRKRMAARFGKEVDGDGGTEGEV